MRIRTVVVLAILMVLGAPTPSAGFEDALTVHATDVGDYDVFTPARIELQRGGTVTYVFDGTRPHTATDGSGLGLYDSGVVFAGGLDEEFTYVSAGRYDVVCSLHANMDARVIVPAGVQPATGTPGTELTVTWASTAAPGGYAYDVQLRKPGGDWVTWRNDVSARRDDLTARRTGTWRFRARMVQPSSTATSDWSPVATAQIG